MADAAPGFRRRRRDAGAAVLLDETAALLQADPAGWAARSLLPSLPLALLGLLFVHLHRVVWAQEAWDGGTTLASLAVSTALVAAIGLRAVGRGVAAREVLRRLDPARAASLPPVDAPALAALGLVLAAACWFGGLFAGLPGFVAAAFFLPALPASACEGRDAGATLSRLGELPRGTVARGFGASLLFALLLLFAWLDVVLGVQGGLMMARTLTGADVAMLERLLGPTNGAFLLSALVVAGFLLDGVWCVYAGVFYVDARLGQSGVDLLERWEEATGGSGPGPGSAGRLAVALLLLLSGSSMAQEGGGLGQAGEAGAGAWAVEDPPSWEGATGGSLVGAEAWAPEPPGHYLADLEEWRAQLGQELTEYEESGFEDLDRIREALRLGTTRRLQTPRGVLELDGSLLADELPEWIHTEGTAEQTRGVIRRLDGAIEQLLALSTPPDPGDPAPVGAADARALLREELGAGAYDLGAERSEGDAFRDSFQERLRARLEAFWRWLTSVEEPPPRNQPLLPEIDGRIVMAAVAALLALILVLFLLGQGRTLRVAAPEGEGADVAGGGALPDARQRSPLGWRGHADQLAAEGLYREAIRAQYLAVLARLDRTGEIDYRRERTNGEHLRTFRGRPPRRAAFGDATWSFEFAWYGEASVDGGDYDAMSAVCDGLVAGGGPDPGGAGEGARG